MPSIFNWASTSTILYNVLEGRVVDERPKGRGDDMNIAQGTRDRFVVNRTGGGDAKRWPEYDFRDEFRINIDLGSPNEVGKCRDGTGFCRVCKFKDLLYITVGEEFSPKTS
jgi:hypothetical protein